ncbi:MAG: glutathione S-transferase family protein [Variibacter sp.]
MALTLWIGNKKYSSWSLRPWIALKVAGIPFEEVLVPLRTDEFKSRVREVSPAGRVPVLRDGDAVVWESLAILEHLAERFPDARLWPAEPNARAHARSIAAEMHGGFGALRSHCPMNMARQRPRALTPEVEADVRRIDAMWSDARARFGKGGPFLFGAFSAADAMYAPVVSRFVSYEIGVSRAARDYMAAVTALPAYAEWKAAGLAEPWVLAGNDPD